MSKALTEAVNALFLCDVWRRLHPNQRQYTWSRVNPSRASGYSRARLDRFYVSLGYIPSVQSCNISSCCLSDHSAVNLKLKVNHTHSNGSAYWHFNNHLLSDETYTSTIRHFWVNWRMEKINFPTLNSWWDFGKRQIKSITQM